MSTYTWGSFTWGYPAWGEKSEDIVCVYDRSQVDIDELKSILDRIRKGGVVPQNYLDGLKGAFNHIDYNRIESNSFFLSNKLKEYGYVANVTVKTDWKNGDLFTLTDLNRVRQNVVNILSCGISPDNVEVITFTKTFNYLQANSLELNLFLVNDYLNKVYQYVKFSGEFYSGE